MKIRYIAIEREYGSGGTKIAQMTAGRCGMRCYGREILEQVARREQVSVSQLEQYEESVSGNLSYSMFVVSQSQTGDPDLLSPEAKLYVGENRIIRELARGGPAIFVGHCCAQALQDEPGLLRVFIHGSEEDKHRRIIEDYGIAPQEVASACRRFNRRRANYYHVCTRKHWEDLHNYDLVLDSSTLGLEGCAEVLTALCKRGKAE